MNEEIVLNLESHTNGQKLINQAEELTKKHFIKKLLLNKFYISKSIQLFLEAGEEFKKINDINLYINTYERTLEQCYILDKFESLYTISVLTKYFSICNEFGYLINNKYINFFEKYAIVSLKKLNKNIKIGNLYKLLAKNVGDTEIAIENYIKSNHFYNKTNLKCVIEENNKEVAKINEILGKNVIWH